MGFATSQKAKTAIVATLSEAGSSLQVSGKVFAFADTIAPDIKIIGVPIKLASGGESVNLDPQFTAVKFISNSVTYDDIYNGTVAGIIDSLFNGMVAGTTGPPPLLCSSNPITGADPNPTCSFIYWTVNINNNSILDQGEHAVLVVAFNTPDKPTPLDKIKIELIPPSGATMTVERQIPNISSTYVDLG